MEAESWYLENKPKIMRQVRFTLRYYRRHFAEAYGKAEGEAIARETLQRFEALLPSEGRNGEAGALMVRSMAPGLRVPGAARVLGAVMGRIMAGEAHPSFASDVMVEAEAEIAYDAREVLPAISVPVLLVCGDEDLYFPKAVYEETARLIPDCTLQMYKGAGHTGAIRDKRFPQEILGFVRQQPATALETEERPTVRREPVGAAAG